MTPTFGKHEYGDKLVLKAQSSAVLEIPFSASPEPTVEWKYKGGRLPDSKRFKDDTVAGLTSLSMSKVIKSDAGEYSLTVENKLGSATFRIKLIVQGTDLCHVTQVCRKLMSNAFTDVIQTFSKTTNFIRDFRKTAASVKF